MNKASTVKIESEIKGVLTRQLKLSGKEISLSTSLREDLGIDSLDVVELMFELEEKFNVVIPDQDIVKLNTVGDLVTYLSQKAAEAQT